MDERSNVSVGDREVALANEIIRVVVGSGVHGMAIEGTDDQDEMGVYVERPEQVMGLAPTSEHYVSRTKPEGVRSGAGDVDLTIYSLRKYLRLATAGNPTVLTLLYAPFSAMIIQTLLGRELQILRSAIVSQWAGRKFLGYLNGQLARMTGDGPHQSRKPKRPELEAAYGYDTKYASHALRLGFQGVELMATGCLTLPLPAPALHSCREVKTGQVDQAEALERIRMVRVSLETLVEGSRHSPLPLAPDWQTVNDWMVYAHQTHWLGR